MADRAAPLAGRTVLLTRPAGRSSALIQRLKGLGAEVEAHPTIALDTPSDPAPARRAVRRLPTFDWVLFTSANGVRFFVSRLHEAGTRTSTIRSRIAAIGPATADALSSAGLTAELVATDSHSEGFAEELRERIAPGQKVLIVGPEVARSVLVDALGEYGAETDAVAFYRNIAAPGVDDVAEQVCRDRYDLVVFTSPSTIRRLLEAGWCSRSQLSRALGRTDIVAIGQVTARAVEEAGLRAAAVARHPNDDGIVAALVGLSREKS